MESGAFGLYPHDLRDKAVAAGNAPARDQPGDQVNESAMMFFSQPTAYSASSLRCSFN